MNNAESNSNAKIVTIKIDKHSFKQEKNPVREKLLKITENEKWHNEAQELLSQSSFDQIFIKEFHTHWVEAGHRIRVQIGNDQTLIKLLKLILPKYEGENIKLYRGENLSRWNAAQIGLCWTSCIKTAQMFGRGLNAIKCGGVLLETECPTHAIISGPNDHSKYLGESEYTIDPSALSLIKVIEKFPPISIIK